MPADPVIQPWTIRSTLIAVADLDRSIAFYSGLGPFELIVREDNVAVLGETSVESLGLILRATDTQSLHSIRHGQQSLGLRFVTFNVGSSAELDRIESHLRGDNLFTTRTAIAEGASQVVLGRDPDHLPLVFVYYEQDSLGPDYFQTIANLVYSLDA